MLTYYCPHCWHTLDAGVTVCPVCGYDLTEFERLPYSQKLIHALHHPIPERRVIAAQVLGDLGAREALPAFEALLDELQGEAYDYYLLRAVLEAIARIPDPRRVTLLRRATHHPADLIARLAHDLLARIEASERLDTPHQALGGITGEENQHT
ncbi:HEAT repeat domain-containing protein [Thermanaerothrix daxensis]|uniref:HEAT repeat domain-containing protein n=1 Tax=Thermanaerothrix daxensis TaxID=869279 RepID=UPI0006C8EC68|nr:HEAT repeat domain-containing protein [Thermanaerothrix daxensis]